MSIEPPFPAVSRPSKTTTRRWLVSDTQRAMPPSSWASGFKSSSYSSSLRLLLPLINAPDREVFVVAWVRGDWNHLRRRTTARRMKLGDSFLRVLVTAGHRLMRAVWFFVRPHTLGAHAFALTPDRQLILVKLRYAPGWRLPGGGCNASEHPSKAALRELREEIGMRTHGAVSLVCKFDQQVHFKQDFASLFVVEDVRYQPSWSWEVEQVRQFSLQDLPPDLAPVTRTWIDAVQTSQAWPRDETHLL